MFDWLKKKELDKIYILQNQNITKDATIAKLEAELEKLAGRLSDAIKIANRKKVVRCYADNCMDWEKGNTCSLNEIVIKTDGKEAFCMDYDNGSVMEELTAEQKGSGRAHLIIRNV